MHHRAPSLAIGLTESRSLDLGGVHNVVIMTQMGTPEPEPA